jgi:hypothetical protein
MVAIPKTRLAVSRRRKKHPYRQKIWIVLGASLIIALLLYLINSHTSSESGPGVSGGDDSPVQFK